MALEKITAEDFNTAIKRLTTSDKSVWWKYLDSTDDGTELCLAVGWQDGYDEDADLYQQDGYTLCAKIGYKHSNTMVMDYSDFREPYDKKGNAWQTDMAVAKGPISDSDVKWYNDEAQRIWDKYGKPDKNGTTALDLMESKKNEEKIPFKLTEFPKELKQLYDACNKRLMTCDNELSSASDVSNKHGVSSATYTFKGEYGSYVKLKVTLDYEDGEFTVSIKGLDETEGYSWDVLGSGTSDNFKSAMDAALAEFDKNIVPLVRKIQNAMKRGESLNKSESARGSMRRKQESLAKKNEGASLDGVVQKVSEGLDTIQKRLESSVNDKEMSDGYWLHLDFDGVLDSRVTGVTDSSHYDVADYEWEPDEKQEIPCRIYRLSVDPGIYDDDGKFVNDNNMSSISYDICVEVAPDGEDITLDILKSENKFGSKSSTITRSLSFSCDSDGVSDMVDSVVDRVMNDLGDYDYLG